MTNNGNQHCSAQDTFALVTTETTAVTQGARAAALYLPCVPASTIALGISRLSLLLLSLLLSVLCPDRPRKMLTRFPAASML